MIKKEEPRCPSAVPDSVITPAKQCLKTFKWFAKRYGELYRSALEPFSAQSKHRQPAAT